MAKTIFDQYDRNRNGTIDAVELRDAIADLGEPFTDQIAASMVLISKK